MLVTTGFLRDIINRQSVFFGACLNWQYGCAVNEADFCFVACQSQRSWNWNYVKIINFSLFMKCLYLNISQIQSFSFLLPSELNISCQWFVFTNPCEKRKKGLRTKQKKRFIFALKILELRGWSGTMPLSLILLLKLNAQTQNLNEFGNICWKFPTSALNEAGG